MFDNTYVKYLFKFLEVLIVGLLIVTVVLTGKEIAITLWHDYLNNHLIENYKLILSEILLLAIGVEMAVLIIKKNIYFVIDILILATARKLITYEASTDIFISIACVIFLLAAKVYYSQKVAKTSKKEEYVMEHKNGVSL